MGQADYFAPGDWNSTCARCGCTRKASTLVKTWDGLYVCPEHWEPRHPQDFVKAVKDNPAVPWVQAKVTTQTAVCSPAGLSAIVDHAIVDCAIVDFVFPGLNLTTGLTE